MPITINQVEENSDRPSTPIIEPGSPGHDILVYLAENPRQGFTQTEIHDATDVDYDRVGIILSQLKDLDIVRYQGVHWAISGDDRLAAYNAMVSASSTSVTDDFYGEDE